MQITSKKQEKIVLGLLLKNGTVDNFYCIAKSTITLFYQIPILL